MQKKNSYLLELLVLVLTLTAVFLLFSILFQFMAVDKSPVAEIIHILSMPGVFLYSSFLWGSFFIPLFLFLCAVFLTSPKYGKNAFIILAASVVPFLTVSILIKVLDTNSGYGSDLTDWMIQSAGRNASAVLLSLIILIEVVLIYRLYMALSYREEVFKDKKLIASKEEKSNLLEVSSETGDGNSYDHAGVVQNDNYAESVDSNLSAEDSFPNGILPVQGKNIYEPALEDVQSEPAQTKMPGKASVSNYISGPYNVPVKGILQDYPDGRYWEIDEETKHSAEILMRTLEEFKIKAEVTGIRKGPVITMFEILPAHGVKISKIVNLADNIALRLAALRVRIVAPIPGKHAVGIEVPNKKRNIVSFKELITLPIFTKSKYEIPVVLGKDITGEAQVVDLVQTPHLLIAGATGSGKSVCVNSIINSILYHKSPDKVKLMLIDPKIVELKFYNDIPHLLTPVITNPKHAYQALQYCINEMERRYALLDSLGVRDIRSYNRRLKEQHFATEELPYLVIVVDEFADLMATSGKEMEGTLARLAAMSRAVGLHLVLATQRPSIDVITGLIKANIPSRIAFMVASKFDSRIIIDSVGAEKLLGKGDMLFSAAWDPVPVRIQGAYLSEEEVEAITDHLRTLGKPDYIDEDIFFDEDEDPDYAPDEEDPLMDRALEIVFNAGKASASFLQRRLKIGYNRAARLVEEMERRGIVGPQNGSKPREIIKAP